MQPGGPLTISCSLSSNATVHMAFVVIFCIIGLMISGAVVTRTSFSAVTLALIVAVAVGIVLKEYDMLKGQLQNIMNEGIV